MPKVLGKILKVFVDILTLLVFLVLIIIIIAKVKMMSGDKEYFEMFGYSIFSVATGSMEPTIKQNDIILVKAESEYYIDDIVTFPETGTNKKTVYITHRIVSKRGDTIVTKGDANNAKDVAINQNIVIGKVIKIFSNAGIWQKVFTTPKIMIMIFITLILFDFAFSYKGIKKKQNIKIVNKIPDVKLSEVNKIEDSPKMTKQEINTLEKKTEAVKNGEDVKFDKKEKEFLNYTIRLDLDELHKEIDDKMSGGKQ